MPKTLSIKTLGCKLNQYESDQIAEKFISAGWEVKPFGEDVDLVVVNTCTITDRSDKSSRNSIRQGARYAPKNKVIVTGCLVNRDKSTVAQMKEVTHAYCTDERQALFQLSQTSAETNAARNPANVFRTRRYIKIQDGCDGSCTYCIIPRVRGVPQSIDYQKILDHAKQLIDEGCPELVLTGISIGKYFHGNKDLSALGRGILNLSGDFRLRITSIEPLHVNDGLIELYDHPKLCSHIHLPLQSGSDKVLASMKRPYRMSDYNRIIEKIKKHHPHIAVGTDIIVGFPTESEQDFQESLNAARRLGYAYLHQFSYSTRKGTAAAQLDSQVSSAEIADRVQRLRDLAQQVGYVYRKPYVGTTLPCVVSSNRSKSNYRAVSSNYIRMRLTDSPLNRQKEGRITQVKIIDTNTDETIGKVVR